MMTTDYSDKNNIEKYAKKPLAYDEVLEPEIIKAIGQVKGKKILDLGCGAGHLARKLSKKGAKITAADPSKEWIEKAKQLSEGYNIDYKVMSGEEMSDLEGADYDFVIMNMVFVNVKSKSVATEIFDEVSRVLKEEGQLIFTDLHPLSFAINGTEKKLLPKGFNYFEDGSSFTSEVVMSDNSIMKFEDKHYTLTGYTEMLEKASMYIHRINELSSSKDFPEYIMFICKLFE